MLTTPSPIHDLAQRALALGLAAWECPARQAAQLTLAAPADVRDLVRLLNAEQWVVSIRESSPTPERALAVSPAPGVHAFRVPLTAPGADPTELIALGFEAPRLASCTDVLSHSLAAIHPAAVSSLLAALQLAAADVLALHERQAAIDNFTVQLSEAFDTIDLLYALGRTMRDPTRPEKFLQIVIDRLHQTMSFGWVVTRLTAGDSIPRAVADRLFEAGLAPRPVHRLYRGTGSLIRTLPPDHAGQVLEGNPALSTHAFPQVLAQGITIHNTCAGVIAAGAKSGADHHISSYDTQLVEAAAAFVGSFLENVALYEVQQDLFLGTLRALTAAIDAKDRYTRGHSERVAHLSSAIARAAGYSTAAVERVRIAGLVHDVGKIGVPEAVLTKAGRLSDVEFDQIKRHPQIGYTILRDIPLLKDVLPGVLHHHERWDGRGYPSGLSAQGIPELARIIAIADTFDAMSSTRSYRPAMARDRVLDELRRSAGTQLDAQLVPLVLTMDLTEYDELVARHAGTDTAIAA